MKTKTETEGRAMSGAIRSIPSILIIAFVLSLISFTHSKAGGGSYTVMVGYSGDQASAMNMAEQYQRNGLDSIFVQKNKGPYQVCFGRFGTKKETLSTVRWLREYSKDFYKFNRGRGPIIVATAGTPVGPAMQTSQTVQDENQAPETVIAQTVDNVNHDVDDNSAAMTDYYLSDPITGGPGRHFGIGILGEFAYEEMDTRDVASIKDKDKVFYPLLGVRLMAGYDDFTIMAEYRRGKKSFDFLSEIGTTQVTYDTDVDIWELEIKGRYFFSGLGQAPDRIVPFAAGGVMMINEEQEFKITSNNATFTPTGTTTMRQQLDVMAVMLGGGAIMPLGKSWGLRAEGLLLYASVERERFDIFSGWSTRSGSGLGIQGTGAVYWSPTDHLGFDLGLYYRHLEVGDDLGRLGRAGMKTSINFLF